MVLYICATPIGNMEDASFRLIRVLQECDLILAEDICRTNLLLRKYDIMDSVNRKTKERGKTKVIAYNDANKERKTKPIINDLINGKEIVMVSDSGTPGISDPGFYLVREAVKAGIKIVPVPGANAAISALVCSGLATDKFTFYGFLPKKTKKKLSVLKEIKQLKHTAVVYESPYRLVKTLSEMNKIMPDKKVVVARELTKKFEEFIRGSVSSVYEQLREKGVKGEIVLVVGR